MDHLRAFMEAQAALLFFARHQAEHHAVNYRDFLVGAAGLMWNGPARGEYAIVVGANWMPHSGGAKVCAEVMAITRGLLRGYHELVGLAVVGMPQPDDESGVAPSTLHPRGGCWRMFREPGVRDAVPILTAVYAPDVPFPPPRQERLTIGELFATHKNGREEQPLRQEFIFGKDWTRLVWKFEHQTWADVFGQHRS